MKPKPTKKAKAPREEYIVNSEYTSVIKTSYAAAEKTAIDLAKAGERRVIIAKVIARASAVVEIV